MVESAPVYAGAGTDTREIGRLGIGDEAPVIDNAGGWYAIQLPNEASGWVQARNVAPVLETFLSDTEAAKLAAAKARALGGSDRGCLKIIFSLYLSGFLHFEKPIKIIPT